MILYNVILLTLLFPASFFCINDSKDDRIMKTKFTPWWGTSNNCLYGPELKASPERGTLFTVPEYERPGYSQDEVYESTVKGWENLSFTLSILITSL